MFLFLSKLFPLLFYPVGLACVLLLAAIATFWKCPRTAAAAVGAALGVLLVSSSALTSTALIRSLESQYSPAVTYPKAGAIVTLGGSVRAPSPPRVWPEVTESGDRILYTARLYRAGAASRVILAGGRISWMEGTSDSEAQDMETLLTFMNVPKSAILLERKSLNTHENAVNVKKILQKERVQEPVLLVTSALHMPRAMAIFKKEGINAIAAPTDYLAAGEAQLSFPELVFGLLPDASTLSQTTLALTEYVGFWIYRLKGWI